jgi:hypothetical protein
MPHTENGTEPGQTECHAIAYPENVERMTERTARSGHLSAVVPQTIFTWPIWLHPRTAAAAGARYERQWVRYRTTDDRVYPWHHGIRVTNSTDDRFGAASSAGALRWIDLDVLMAISHAAYRAKSLRVEIEQADLLRWMGYEDLLAAPYDVFRASLTRLAATHIEHWDAKERPPAPDRVALLTGFSHEKPTRVGGAARVIVGLSDFWAQQITAGQWQEVDLDAYAYLAREYRNHGLARVLFCWLTAHRLSGKPGQFVARKEDMIALFRPRKPDGKGVRYRDPLHPKSALTVALKLLQESGLIEPAGHPDPTMMAGSLHPEKAMGFVEHRRKHGRQEYLCTSDVWGGGVAPQMIQHQVVDQVVGPAAAPPTELAPLLARCPVAAAALARARERGWDTKALGRLLGLALVGHRLGTVREAAAWAAGILHQEDQPWDPKRFSGQLTAWGTTATAATAMVKTLVGKSPHGTPMGHHGDVPNGTEMGRVPFGADDGGKP